MRESPPAKGFLLPNTCRKSKHTVPAPCAAPDPSSAGSPHPRALCPARVVCRPPSTHFLWLKLTFLHLQAALLGFGCARVLFTPTLLLRLPLCREPNEELGLCAGRGSLLLISLVIYCALPVNGSSPSSENDRGCSALIPQSLGSSPLPEPTLESPHTGITLGVTTGSLKKNQSCRGGPELERGGEMA